ncbi:MAG: transcription termination/antitermination NusG family protein [Chitinophagaceae bacterium]
MQNSSWYAVYTKPFWENRVTRMLIKANLKTYCPLQKTLRQWSDRKKVVYTPLFRSYVFVNITAQEIPLVKQVYGIISFVSNHGKPAIIRTEEIETIRQFNNDYEDIMIQKVEIPDHSQTGPLHVLPAERSGKVVQLPGDRVEVYLPSFGFRLSARKTRTEHLEQPAGIPAKQKNKKTA